MGRLGLQNSRDKTGCFYQITTVHTSAGLVYYVNPFPQGGWKLNNSHQSSVNQGIHVPYLRITSTPQQRHRYPYLSYHYVVPIHLRCIANQPPLKQLAAHCHLFIFIEQKCLNYLIFYGGWTAQKGESMSVSEFSLINVCCISKGKDA